MAHRETSGERISAHWFTYEGDGDMLLVSMAAFRKTVPEARLVVINDSHHSATPGVRLACESMGAEWRESTWERGGNLRGNECITGILSELAATSETSDVIIKIDPDTLVIGRDWLDDFLESSSGMAAADDREAAYGCCYALRGEHVQGVYKSACLYPPNDCDVEDLYIAQRFNYLYPGQFRRIPIWRSSADNYGNGPHGSFIAYNWKTPLTAEKILEYARRWDIINCANRPPARITREEITTLMHRIFKASRP